MFARRKQNKEAKKALKSETLQNALQKASAQHFSKFSRTRHDIPWDKHKDISRKIRKKNLPRLPELIQKFKEEAEKSGSIIHLASDVQEALAAIKTIITPQNGRLIVKSKSMVTEEMELNRHLEDWGYSVVETDLGEWIVQLAGEKPSHITAPALHKTKKEIADLLSQKLGKNVSPDAQDIVKLARSEMRKIFSEADIGISGANFAVAESGTLVIISNEGNARLVTSLPPVHIAIVTTEKFVETLEEATSLVKTLIEASSGMKMTSYVSFITGPSRTTDIEKELIMGVHGPREVHIVILDNGRLDVRKDKDMDQTLYCLKCGGCMLVCPVFLSLGGHVYGGPVYPGGIGLLLTEVLDSFELSKPLLDFCADCKKCEEFCPVGIPSGELLFKLKEKKGGNYFEKTLSMLFRNKTAFEFGLKLLTILQKLWIKDGFIKKLPFPWTKGKHLPALSNRKIDHPVSKNNGKTIYFFQGCLAKSFFPELKEAVLSSLSSYGYRIFIPDGQTCCGAPSLHLGQTKDVQKLFQTNWESFKKEDPDFILTICPTGTAMLTKTYPKLDPAFSPWIEKICSFSDFLVKKGHLPDMENKRAKTNIFYHHPCHNLYDLKIKDQPLTVLRNS
ncbi:LUD domain-containing protein, partial [Acidobacteriota bacterium]